MASGMFAGEGDFRAEIGETVELPTVGGPPAEGVGQEVFESPEPTAVVDYGSDEEQGGRGRAKSSYVPNMITESKSFDFGSIIKRKNEEQWSPVRKDRRAKDDLPIRSQVTEDGTVRWVGETNEDVLFGGQINEITGGFLNLKMGTQADTTKEASPMKGRVVEHKDVSALFKSSDFNEEVKGSIARMEEEKYKQMTSLLNTYSSPSARKKKLKSDLEVLTHSPSPLEGMSLLGVQELRQLRQNIKIAASLKSFAFSPNFKDKEGQARRKAAGGMSVEDWLAVSMDHSPSKQGIQPLDFPMPFVKSKPREKSTVVDDLMERTRKLKERMEERQRRYEESIRKEPQTLEIPDVWSEEADAGSQEDALANRKKEEAPKDLYPIDFEMPRYVKAAPHVGLARRNNDHLAMRDTVGKELYEMLKTNQIRDPSIQNKTSLVDYHTLATAFRRKGDLPREAFVHYALGVSYDNGKDYEKAILCYKSYLVICRRLEDAAGAAMAHNHIGVDYQLISNSFAKKKNEPGPNGTDYQAIARDYARKAAKYHRKHFEHCAKSERALALCNMAIAYRSFNDSEGAEKCIHQALRMTLTIPETSVKAKNMVYGQQGIQMFKRDFYGSAFDWFTRFRDRACEAYHVNDAVQALVILGRCANVRKEYVEAATFFEQARELAVKHGLPKRIGDNLDVYVGVATGNAKAERALEALQHIYKNKTANQQVPPFDTMNLHGIMAVGPDEDRDEAKKRHGQKTSRAVLKDTLEIFTGDKTEGEGDAVLDYISSFMTDEEKLSLHKHRVLVPAREAMQRAQDILSKIEEDPKEDEEMLKIRKEHQKMLQHKAEVASKDIVETANDSDDDDIMKYDFETLIEKQRHRDWNRRMRKLDQYCENLEIDIEMERKKDPSEENIAEMRLWAQELGLEVKKSLAERFEEEVNELDERNPAIDDELESDAALKAMVGSSTNIEDIVAAKRAKEERKEKLQKVFGTAASDSYRDIHVDFVAALDDEDMVDEEKPDTIPE